MTTRKQPIPAAAVAFVRDTADGIEVYLSRRPAHFRYYGGAFVFPGGTADPEDADLKATATREVKEEVGLDIDPSRLRLLRETHTSAHAGPVYHMLTYAYSVEGEFETSLNEEEVDEEMWIVSREALTLLDLPYQIRAAVHTISGFGRVSELMRALEAGSFNEDYRI